MSHHQPTKTYRVGIVPAPEQRFPSWQSAAILRDFSSPWLEVDDTGTAFRALHDGAHLYFRFDVEESNILVYEKDLTKFDVLNSERVEIFSGRTRN